MIKIDKIFYQLENKDEFWDLHIKLVSDDLVGIRNFITKYHGEEVASKFDISKPSLYFRLYESFDNLKLIIEHIENHNLQGFLLHLDSSFVSVKKFSEYLIKDFDLSSSKINGG